MTVPVPGWPGSGWYPGSVRTTTMWTIVPEIVDPDLEIELETITAMKAGTVPGGPALLPGPVDQRVPQVAGTLGLFAKPLKLSGADPPLSEFSFAHWAPQNVTCEPTPADWSPTTKAP